MDIIILPEVLYVRVCSSQASVVSGRWGAMLGLTSSAQGVGQGGILLFSAGLQAGVYEVEYRLLLHVG